MQPRIDADRAFDQDPLLQFTSETPVAPQAWEPRPVPPSTFTPARESNGPTSRRRHSNSATLFAAVAASLAVGIVIGFAGGYASALRAGTPLATIFPASRAVTREASTTAPAAASIGAPVSKGTADSTSESSQPSEEAPAWLADAESGVLQEPAKVSRVPDVSPPATSRASIEVSSLPAGAVVALDGRVVGRTPLSIPNVPEGTHVIGMELPGFNRWATPVHVNAGERARVAGSLSP